MAIIVNLIITVNFGVDGALFLGSPGTTDGNLSDKRFIWHIHLVKSPYRHLHIKSWQKKIKLEGDCTKFLENFQVNQSDFFFEPGCFTAKLSHCWEERSWLSNLSLAPNIHFSTYVLKWMFEWSRKTSHFFFLVYCENSYCILKKEKPKTTPLLQYNSSYFLFSPSFESSVSDEQGHCDS